MINQLYKDNYKEYVKIQTEVNKRKLTTVWIKEDGFCQICKFLKENNVNVKYGICHGVRNAVEVKWFKEYFNANFIGTEISETAFSFKDTIQWDFHHIKDEWINKFDVIYSNSLDHSYDPDLCLKNWFKTLNKDGFMFIEWANDHGPKDKNTPLLETDKIIGEPFRATKEQYIDTINKHGTFLKDILYLRRDNNRLAYILIAKK